MKPKNAFGKPADCDRVLLHACCAPCSSAIVEWLLNNGVRPTIFYYNPNIFPREEYEIRKHESKRHAESLGIEWIDGDYNHESWLQCVCGLEKSIGIKYFTTTLASSRWKSLEQISRAGHIAEQMVNEQGSMVNEVVFWDQNWRKGGLYERRNQLLKEFNFYNQQYCGCEFSKQQREAYEIAKNLK